MSGQMCWLPRSGGNGELILHLRVEVYKPWQPYTHFPGIAAPDYRVPGGSKGFATSQKLLAAGWTLLSTAEVKAALNPTKVAQV
jgi:hypothetical protein